ncbi:haloacid dehalogenase [Cellulomonas cellasea DSM 20118]|uniref:Haloacid dehalogenase n=2 Tax=Cellulomonas cellasea TaxID=43670 RepID=A0A0A0B654_9CELL|nr:HAD-IB family hydrolase [Cellulomonas cellasea]KGM00756.1 haloacid dehalogenase [Cellulomonas cellasea DSM 20118]GEA86403.1 hydrolase [Cellulomonas cellasea]
MPEPTTPDEVAAAGAAVVPHIVAAPDAPPRAAGRAHPATPDAGAEEVDAGTRPRVGAFFDVDNTIIRGASAFHLAVGLYRRGFFRKRDLLSFGLHQSRYQLFGENLGQIDEVRSRALSIMTGHSVAEVTAIAEDVYDEVLCLRIYPGTQKLLDEHIAAGHQVWLVTATPVEVGELIARRLGVTGALGTIAEHKDGFYTGYLVGDLLHGEAKACAVRTLAERDGLDLTQSYAYGDSTNDVPILSEVGFPCAINPDGRLRRHAREVGWPIREFRGRRRAARRGVNAASLAGLAWVGGLVFRAIRRAVRP